MVELGLAVAAFTATRMDHLYLYLSADAGHYLADADAVFGHGVRESRHLPLYPALLGALRLVVGDVQAVMLAMVILVLLLVLCFYAFLRGRLGSPVAEAVGTAFFVLAPLMAEAVGWHGGSMLLGLALSFLAMRLIDEALANPSWRRAGGAGLACGLVGLSHPLPLALLSQVVALVAVALLGRAGWRGVRTGRWDWAGLRRGVVVLGAIGAVTAAMVSWQVGFYAELRSPVAFSFDPSRLGTLDLWAFREDPVLWFVLLACGLVLIPGGRRLNGEPGCRLGIWATAIGLVVAANLLVVGGHASYTTRYLYALPAFIACGVAVVVALLTRMIAGSPPSSRGWLGALVTVAVGTSVLRAAGGYAIRLDVALAYYNTVTPDELAAIRWLRGRDGTVAVTAKGSDKVAGTLYAWTIEGLAEMRAIGTGEAFLSVLDGATQDSLSVERLVGGTFVAERGPLRVSTSDSVLAPIDIAGRVGGDWFPLLSISAATDHGMVDARTTIVPDGARPGNITLRSGDLEVMSSFPGSGGPGLDLRLRATPGEGSIALDVEPPVEGSAVVTTDRRGTTISRTIRGHRVEVRLRGGPVTSTREQYDAQSGATRLHMEVPGDSTSNLSVSVVGLDLDRRPVAVFRDKDLLKERDLRYLYTWRETGTAAVLGDRACFKQAMQNDEVVIFAVTPGCRRAPTARNPGR